MKDFCISAFLRFYFFLVSVIIYYIGLGWLVCLCLVFFYYIYIAIHWLFFGLAVCFIRFYKGGVVIKGLYHSSS